MPNRSRTTEERQRDENQLAKSIVDEATGSGSNEKNPAAVALGRLGGKRGGPARAKKLTKEERIKIARRAAQARWEAVRKETEAVADKEESADA